MGQKYTFLNHLRKRFRKYFLVFFIKILLVAKSEKTYFCLKPKSSKLLFTNCPIY